MSSAHRVPETRLMAADELSPDAVWRALRRYTGWRLIRDAFVRFRYGDGFSSARALAFQLCLAVVPFMIALVGLAARLGAEQGGHVIAETVLGLTPNSSTSLVTDVLPDHEDRAGVLALVLGLITGLASLSVAMAQIERGANRIYGVERDRPAVAKYSRAVLLALGAGLPALAGFLILVAGRTLGTSLAHWYHWEHWTANTFQLIRWPLGLILSVLSITLLFRYSPRRRQPSMSWLLVGAGVALALWWLTSLALARYVRASGAFGQTYGPLTAVIALLVWANLTGIALFLGLAFAAQLEARRVGVPQPAVADRWEPQDAESAGAHRADDPTEQATQLSRRSS